MSSLVKYQRIKRKLAIHISVLLIVYLFTFNFNKNSFAQIDFDQNGFPLDYRIEDVSKDSFAAFSEERSISTSIKTPMLIDKNHAGYIRRVYGPMFNIDLNSIGCDNGNLENRGRCFLSMFGSHFGIADHDTELSFSKTMSLDNNLTTIKFGQIFNGKPVLNKSIVLTLANSKVISVYSNLALPIVNMDNVQAIESNLNSPESEYMNTVNIITDLDGLVCDSSYDAYWTKRANNGFELIPVVRVISKKGTDGSVRYNTILRKEDKGIVLHQDLVDYSYPDAYFIGTTLSPDMTHSSEHPLCTSFPNTCEPEQLCSDHYPHYLSGGGRCVGKCTQTEDCEHLGMDCFVDYQPSGWQGYCYSRIGGSSYREPTEPVAIYTQWGGENEPDEEMWYNYNLSFHKGFSLISEQLRALVDFHYYDMGIEGYDNQGSPYKIYHFIQCDCWEGETGCDVGGCRGPSAAPYFINLTNDLHLWLSPMDDNSIWFSYRVIGHEFGHVIQCAFDNNYQEHPQKPLRKTCLNESLADMFGVLFARYTLGAHFTHTDCFGFLNDAYGDDRSGLVYACCNDEGMGCLDSAIRSMLDVSSCDEDLNLSYGVCSSHDDCYDYNYCDGVNCKTNFSAYNAAIVFRRMARIMAEGGDVVQNDGNHENLNIINRPIGYSLAAKIHAHVAGEMTTDTDQNEWMKAVLEKAYIFDDGQNEAYSAMVDALSVCGFYARRTRLSGYRTNHAAIKILFNGWNKSDKKEFVFWVTPDSEGEIWYKYWEGTTKKFGRISSANTDSRPTAVEWGSYLYLFIRDKDYQRIKVFMISNSGFVFGPVFLHNNMTPNGAFAATTFENRLYLIYGDHTNSDRLTISWCDQYYCNDANDWHDFGGLQKKKVISDESFIPGMSAVSSDYVNGMDTDENRMFIASAIQVDGMIRVYRMNSNDLIDHEYEAFHPSFESVHTSLPLGITVRRSAFDQLVSAPPPFYFLWGPRNYLQLIWQDRQDNEERIYTSVLQNASPVERWFTYSRDIKHDHIKPGTGVSWTLGAHPDDHSEIIVINSNDGAVDEIDVKGRY